MIIVREIVKFGAKVVGADEEKAENAGNVAGNVAGFLLKFAGWKSCGISGCECTGFWGMTGQTCQNPICGHEYPDHFGFG
jgi:hypothetical protein